LYINWDGERTPIDEKDLILFTDTASLICEDTLLPEGRLKELEYPITLVPSSYEALATLIQNKGPMTVISSDSKDATGPVSMLPNEKDQIHEDFRKTYGLTRSQAQHIITSAAIKVQPIAWDVKQMGIFETLEIAKMEICDVYNFPYELMSAAKGNTFANKNEAKKSAYQDATIPTSKAIMEQLNMGLNTEAANVEYVISYEDVEVLQESRKIKAEADLAQLNAEAKAWELGLRTRNMILLNTGKDIVNDDAFNKYKMQEDAENEERTAKLNQNAQQD